MNFLEIFLCNQRYLLLSDNFLEKIGRGGCWLQNVFLISNFFNSIFDQKQLLRTLILLSTNISDERDAWGYRGEPLGDEGGWSEEETWFETFSSHLQYWSQRMWRCRWYIVSQVRPCPCHLLNPMWYAVSDIFIYFSNSSCSGRSCKC